MRAAITILAVVIAIAFGVALATKNAKPPGEQVAQTTDPTQAPVPATDEAAPGAGPSSLPETGQAPPAEDADQPPTATAELAAPPDAIPGLHVQAAAKANITKLGSTDMDGPDAMQVEFTGWGAGIYRITLSQYNETVVTRGERQPLVIQSPMTAPDGNGGTVRKYAFSAQSVVVNGETIYLEDVRWQDVAPGHYVITLVDGDEQPVLRITRQYELSKLGPERGHDLTCFQTFENLCERPLRVQWSQNGQSDLPADTGYLGDRRQFIAGYYNLDIDPKRVLVYTDHALFAHADILKRLDAANGSWTIWPGDLEAQAELAWLAAVNRYFAVAVHQPVRVPEEADATPRVVPALDGDFPTVRVRALGVRRADSKTDPRELYSVLAGRPLDLAPGQSAELNIALFAGPRKPELFAQPPYSWMHFSEIIRYELGCTWCTFQWLARGLLNFLKFIHVIVRDWAISIVILVLIVRGLLHPITKRAQINMTKMGKSMQLLQPEMEKLKAKYKDNPQKLQSETMALYREKGVNPANMLGCLPMFLQMPLWVALYAMLAFAIELRHEPAFYGIFQNFAGWQFLADLSSPDRLIRFYPTPQMFFMIDYSSLNLLPLLMGVVFYINQRLTTPPPANEQAAQQQKIMKYMTLLFPLFLYSAPSGLTLYILASTCAGIVDSYLVRRHIKREEEAGTLFKKKPPKEGGFMDRMRKAMEARQRQLQKAQAKAPSERGDRPRRKKRR